MRVGFMLTQETTVKDLVRGSGPSAKVDVLAVAMPVIAQRGTKSKIWKMQLSINSDVDAWFL